MAHPDGGACAPICTPRRSKFSCGEAASSGKQTAAAVCGHALLASVVVLAIELQAHADERIFGYVFTTDTMPHGRFEQQNWLTAGLGKSRGDYQLYQLSNGVDYGVTDPLQAAIYLDSHYVTGDRDSPGGRTSGPFVPFNVDPFSRYSSAAVDGVTFAAKYRLTSPYIDGYGLALALQPMLGPRDMSVEYRVIGQQDFYDDTLIWATNLALNQEWEHVSASSVDVYNPTAPGRQEGWNRKSSLEFDTGLSVRFAENWFLGLEFRNVNGFSGTLLQQAAYSAFFLGPNLHYGGERFWATFAVLPQLPVGRAFSADARQIYSDGRIYGDEHEGIEARFGFGIQF
jgi:hypothetical protein